MMARRPTFRFVLVEHKRSARPSKGETVNLHENEWDVERRSADGVSVRMRHVGHRLETDLIGGTMMEVGPGYLGPYHLHHGNEELLLVLDGRPTVRTPEGEREFEPGDVVFFPRGPDGLHAIENRSDRPVRFFLLSSKVHPDVTQRPEEGLVGVFAGDVPTLGRDAPFEAFFPDEAAVA
jgi:uncharacterized cupin superfamily protein